MAPSDCGERAAAATCTEAQGGAPRTRAAAQSRRSRSELYGLPGPRTGHAPPKFPEIRYLDLIFNGGNDKKAAWVLPVSAQTEATGTLADYLVSLGAIVHEVDLDEDDDAERDEGALVDDEAEEGNDDDDE